MPEGDTIFRTATQLRRFMLNESFENVTARETDFPVQRLMSKSVTNIEARGKHLLIHFETGDVVHSHMGMTGSWHLYPTGRTWKKPRKRAALIFENERLNVVCFSPKTLELLSPVELRRHRYLRNLGPDFLADSISLPVMIRRFRQQNQVTIGEAVMNQTIVCGIGNVYKSEVLFLTNRHPRERVGNMSDQQLEGLLVLSRDLMQKNLEGYPRRTRFENRVDRLWVYGRRGKPCFRCETRIEMIRQGDLARSTYWCPKCQPAIRSVASDATHTSSGSA